jgi:hypothetical protein
MKDEEWSGLLKLPSEVIIKELRFQLGQSKSFITELEDKLNLLTAIDVKIQYVKSLENKISNLEKKLQQSRKECNKVVLQNLRLQKELFKIYKENDGKSNI